MSRHELLEQGEDFKLVATLNSEIIIKANEDKSFGDIIKKSYATLDGEIPYRLARLKNPRLNFEKISGSDFIYDVCSFAAIKKRKVYLLGGVEECNALAKKKLQELYPVEIEAYSPPYSPYPFKSELNQDILNRVLHFRPYYLFVGFGSGKQERWIFDHQAILEEAGVRLAVGSGGTFEMVAGKLKRAPRFIQKMGLEGVYRFLIEPKWFRLKRLLISLKIFFYI